MCPCVGPDLRGKQWLNISYFLNDLTGVTSGKRKYCDSIRLPQGHGSIGTSLLPAHVLSYCRGHIKCFPDLNSTQPF